MATILRKGLIHVRKTIAFDGSAGNGAVGTVLVFTITGRVAVQWVSAQCTENIVDAGGGTPAVMAMGVVDGESWIYSQLEPDGLPSGSFWTTIGGWSVAAGMVPYTIGDSFTGSGPLAIVGNVIITVENEAITDGTLVIDFWYFPMTDDGALAGDDSDEGAIDGYDLEEAMRIVLAALAGKVSGAESNEPVFRSADDAKDRITATTTAAGNRTAVTLDGS